MKHTNLAERESARTRIACEGRSAQPSHSAVQICPSRPFLSQIILMRLHEGRNELPIHEVPPTWLTANASCAVMDLMRLPLGILTGAGLTGARTIRREPQALEARLTARTRQLPSSGWRPRRCRSISTLHAGMGAPAQWAARRLSGSDRTDAHHHRCHPYPAGSG